LFKCCAIQDESLPWVTADEFTPFELSESITAKTKDEDTKDTKDTKAPRKGMSPVCPATCEMRLSVLGNLGQWLAGPAGQPLATFAKTLFGLKMQARLSPRQQQRGALDQRTALQLKVCAQSSTPRRRAAALERFSALQGFRERHGKCSVKAPY
jgi:hypothetical protein